MSSHTHDALRDIAGLSPERLQDLLERGVWNGPVSAGRVMPKRLCRVAPVEASGGDVAPCRVMPDVSPCRVMPDVSPCRVMPGVSPCRVMPA